MGIPNLGQIQELTKRCSENFSLQEVHRTWARLGACLPFPLALLGILRFVSLERVFPEFLGMIVSSYSISLKSSLFEMFNPLTPVPPVTGRDEPWPFFHS